MKTKPTEVNAMLPRTVARLYRSREISRGGTLYTEDHGEIKLFTYSIAIRAEAKLFQN